MSELEQWAGRLGQVWAARVEAIDRQLHGAGEVALRALAPEWGERVLEVGCGSGATTAEIARAVGPEGAVTAVDVSPDLLAAARARPGTAGVRFLEADATVVALPGGHYDALFSRFGCMFFEDAPRAYANLAGALRPGARAVFAVWAEPGKNPWAAVPAAAAAEVLGPAEPKPLGAPGPFGWAEAEVYRPVLAGAGLRIEDEEEHAIELVIGEGEDPDPLVRGVKMVMEAGPVSRRIREVADPELVEAVRARLAERLAPHVRDGWLRLPGTVRVIRARR